MGTKITLQDVRMLSNDLFEPVQYQGKGDHKYQIVLAIPKDQKAKIKQVEDAIFEAALQEWPKDAKKKIESYRGSKQQFFFRDGDTVEWAGAEGCMLVTAKRSKKAGPPRLLDTAKRVITEDNGVLYSGCYVHAIIEPWAQSGENPGIRCGFVSIMKSRDGEAFTAASRPSEADFADIAVADGGADDMV